ncbi:histidine phosphatase superfamily [Sporodiniella umbellata]|nr:histidine phosphatase superfamily [Sporodiniella umbellata]
MVLKTIWVTRHGFREDWVNVDPPLPTNLLQDPTLSKVGRQQAQELKTHLQDKSIQRVYSSPFYRVLETVSPLVEECNIPLFIDNSMAEWYGMAYEKYLPPATNSELMELFPRLDLSHQSSVPIPTGAETKEDCHKRLKVGLDKLVHDLDNQNVQTVLLSGHAASVICAVRALLNQEQYPVRSGTCSLSRLTRNEDLSWELHENGNCDHLSQGEQWSWRFSGEIPDYAKKKKAETQ